MILETTNITIAAVNVGLGLVLVGICIPLLLRKVPMNGFYGFRIGAAMESDDDWYDINAYGAKWTIIWSVPIVVIGLAALFIDFENNGDLMPYFEYAWAIVLIPVVQAIIYAKTRDL